MFARNSLKSILAIFILPFLLLFSGCASKKNLVKKSKLEKIRKENRELREKNKNLKKQYKNKVADVKTLKKSLEEKVATRDNKLSGLRKKNNQLEESLSNVKKVTTRREGQNVVVSLQAKILFDLGEYQLKPGARKTLRKIAKVIEKYSDRRIMVQGHADTIPVLPGSRFPSNWHLSAARSVSVVQFLTQEYGILPDRFIVAGLGDHHPIKPNTTPTARRKNRRVEIVFFPKKIKKKTITPTF